ncbi:unnamed protein product [Lepidochelys kempii]
MKAGWQRLDSDKNKRPGMPSGARMPHQGAPMGPPGSPYVGSPSVRPGMPQTVMEPTRKRTAPQQVQQPQVQPQVQPQQQATPTRTRSAKRRKMADKILPQRIRELVPESQAYMDLLAFERKLDQTIMRKRVDIQEALKRPMKQKRKLRLYISNTFNPAKSDADDSDGSIASWELRVEGKLLDDISKQKRKFSSFFKSLVIELDKDLYGPDNHLVEWHRTPTTQETDGFQVKRPGDVSVRCTLLLMLDYQPPQFKLDPRLARLLGIHTQTRSAIIQALWQYIKTNKLQDSHDKEYINCDKYFQQIFDCPRLKFSEIPQRLTNLLLPPDPIVINHIISVDPNDQKKTACYDIDVEVEDPLKGQMSSFLLSTANQQEITALDNKIHETIESINQLKIQRDFMLSFSKDPKGYIQDLLRSQSRDLKEVLNADTLDFRKADFDSLREWMARIPWGTNLKGKGVQESWLYFKESLLRLQGQTIPMSRKNSKYGRRPAWLNGEILADLKHKKEAYKKWKVGHMTREEYKNIAQACRNDIRRAKSHLELQLARDVKSNKKGFFRYVGNKKKAKECVGPLLNEGGNLVTEDVEKANVLNAFFASVFTNKVSSQTAALGITKWGRDGQPSVEIEVVRDYLEKLDVHKSMGPDELHPRVLKELAAVIAEPLAIIFENSWRTGEVPDDWKKANVVPIFKKGKKEDPGNYRPVSLTSVPGKIMEQVLKESILKHLHERKVIRNSQQMTERGVMVSSCSGGGLDWILGKTFSLRGW